MNILFLSDLGKACSEINCKTLIMKYFRACNKLMAIILKGLRQNCEGIEAFKMKCHRPMLVFQIDQSQLMVLTESFS